MKPKYKKYKIKKGDTLQSISKILEKSEHEVKSFHNVFCDNDSYIGNQFPSNLEELYIYPEYNEKQLSLIPKVTFEGAYKLGLKPSQIKSNYGVMYTITSGEETNTVKFETSVIFKERTVKNTYIYEIDRVSETYINDEEATSLADELAEKTSKVLYPLKIEVDNEGKWIEINNYNEIYNRWEKTKEKILSEYEGEWVEKYLKENQETIESEGRLQTALSKDWFLNSYFASIYVYYTHKYQFEVIKPFPILVNCNSVNYKVKQKINEYLDEHNLIKIEQNGNLEDERSKTDLQNEMNIPYYATLYPNQDIAEGTFRSLYFLNGKSNLIESLFLECSINLDIEKKIQVVVSLL